MYVNTVFLFLFSHYFWQFQHPTSHLRAFSTNGPEYELNRTIGCEYYGTLRTTNDNHGSKLAQFLLCGVKVEESVDT